MRGDDDVLRPGPPGGGANTSRLEMHRSKRGPDLFRAYHVKVDGREIGQIRRGESRAFPLLPGRHKVHVEIDWCRSPAISIDAVAGETVKLMCYPKSRAWQWKKALANPDEYLVLGADGDG
jgi:hypothetical protein